MLYDTTQANVCAESNDNIASHFSNCVYTIGGKDSSGNYLAGLGYLYNGAWQPYYTTDPIPSAYTYHGNSLNNTNIFRVGSQGPMSWFGVQRNTAQTYESLKFGYNIAVPTHGTQIW